MEEDYCKRKIKAFDSFLNDVSLSYHDQRYVNDMCRDRSISIPLRCPVKGQRAKKLCVVGSQADDKIDDEHREGETYVVSELKGDHL